MMNINDLLALRRENEEQTTFASHEWDGKSKNESLLILRDGGSESAVADASMPYAHVTGEQVGQNSDTFTPVTIKRIQDAVSLAQDTAYINNHVTVVARVVSLDAQNTKISLMLDDCTSKIPAVYLTNSDQDVSLNNLPIHGRAYIKEDVWIRVNGIVCRRDGCYEISVIKMRPVVDYNEVVFHRLDTVKIHLMLTDQCELEGIVGM